MGAAIATSVAFGADIATAGASDVATDSSRLLGASALTTSCFFNGGLGLATAGAGAGASITGGVDGSSLASGATPATGSGMVTGVGGGVMRATSSGRGGWIESLWFPMRHRLNAAMPCTSRVIPIAMKSRQRRLVGAEDAASMLWSWLEDIGAARLVTYPVGMCTCWFAYVWSQRIPDAAVSA